MNLAVEILHPCQITTEVILFSNIKFFIPAKFVKTIIIALAVTNHNNKPKFLRSFATVATQSKSEVFETLALS